LLGKKERDPPPAARNETNRERAALCPAIGFPPVVAIPLVAGHFVKNAEGETRGVGVNWRSASFAVQKAPERNPLRNKSSKNAAAFQNSSDRR
jgi:hypothetical protein